MGIPCKIFKFTMGSCTFKCFDWWRSFQRLNRNCCWTYIYFLKNDIAK